MMKTISKIAAQGDVIFRRIESLPEGVEKISEGKNVIAHSETGHNHVALGGTLYQKPDDGMLAYLVINEPTVVEHHRSWDTHESLELLADSDGEVIWEIRRQREYTPKGWRRVED